MLQGVCLGCTPPDQCTGPCRYRNKSQALSGGSWSFQQLLLTGLATRTRLRRRRLTDQTRGVSVLWTLEEG